MKSVHFTHYDQIQNFEFSNIICLIAFFNLYKTIDKSYQIHIKRLLYIEDTDDRNTNHFTILNSGAYIANMIKVSI